ncbi:MAG TPA: hypothetical protein VME24_13420, partial [Alphaproteobacteria bacterium]|nr:hypothetical protein [Alphaproteobacteria bacterium]
QQAGCFNNLKQLGEADLVYVADHGVFVQPSQSQYLGQASEWIGVMVDNTSRNTNILLCPTASEPAPTAIANEYGLETAAGQVNTVGTADYCYVRGGLSGGESGLSEISASYMANGWLYYEDGGGQGDGVEEEGIGPYPPDPGLYYTNEASMNMPGKTPLFFDGAWVDTWPLETDSCAKNLYTGILGEGERNEGNEMGRLTMTRHSINPEMAERNHVKSWKISPPSFGGIDMVFGDGHSQFVKMNPDIYNFNWHRRWGVYVPVNPGSPQ